MKTGVLNERMKTKILTQGLEGQFKPSCILLSYILLALVLLITTLKVPPINISYFNNGSNY